MVRRGLPMALENPALNAEAFGRGVARAGEGRPARYMTARGTYAITALLLLLLIAAAAVGWAQVSIQTVQVSTKTGLQNQTYISTPGWLGLVFLLTFIVALVSVFSPQLTMITGPLYALGEGALLGVLSHYYDATYEGIVLQAVAATVCVFLTMLILFSTHLIKVSARFVLGVVAAMSALLLLYFVAWLLTLFGAHLLFWNHPTPLGIALSVAIVILGALNLPIDFEFIEIGAARGAPGYMAWYCAFGLMLSLIWIYVSILRLLALLSRAGG
jgi:uncharacterized YccA/Bax inhibitor family protein